ncbi:hypothetical protein Leryth_026096 [Lithospermum erythrorhizon]|nr:hypothetical protein Leryth_026096 [Lithospermum erythrorhizon]
MRTTQEPANQGSVDASMTIRCGTCETVCAEVTLRRIRQNSDYVVECGASRNLNLGGQRMRGRQPTLLILEQQGRDLRKIGRSGSLSSSPAGCKFNGDENLATNEAQCSGSLWAFKTPSHITLFVPESKYEAPETPRVWISRVSIYLISYFALLGLIALESGEHIQRF